MKKLFFFAGRYLVAAALLLGPTACVKDLDREPFYDLNTESVYRDPTKYIELLGKLYAGFMLGGQNTTGASDVVYLGPENDEGAASYFRPYWCLQQWCTDETAIAWNSQPLQDLNQQNWNSGNYIIQLCYNRIFYEIALCNEFIRETADDKLSDRGIKGSDADRARQYRAEARFLRALAYSHAIDLFGNVPFTTEKAVSGAYLPPQISRADLFAYIESELKAIEGSLAAPRTPGYGHADQAAAWTLLAHMYLNAEVYSGTARYADCLTYCNKVLGAGYALAPEYRLLFLADNNEKAASEIIFPLTSDGRRQQTYGGTTFLIHSSVGGGMLNYGVDNGWSGNRTRQNLPLLFPDVRGTGDRRGNFFVGFGGNLHTLDQGATALELASFLRGYAVTKWKNVKSTGAPGSDLTFVDTDFPLFRLADVYLMYAEAALRTSGDRGQALAYVNELRTRALAAPVTDGQLNLDFILDERARELYWEAHRRTDLIRFGKFTDGTYLWPWKGNAPNGQSVGAFRNLYPLPASDIVANPSLKQNPGY